MNMSEKAIDYTELPEGIIRSLNVTYELNRDAQFVYDTKKYRSSIILSTYSIEESNRCAQLLIAYTNFESLSEKELSDMHNHKTKNTKVLNNVLKSFLNPEKRAECDVIRKEIYKLAGVTSKEKIATYDEDIKNIKNMKNLYGALHKLRILCLYTHWSKQKKKWYDMQIYSNNEIHHLSALMIFLSNMEISSIAHQIKYSELYDISVRNDNNLEKLIQSISISSMSDLTTNDFDSLFTIGNLDIIKLIEKLCDYVGK